MSMKRPKRAIRAGILTFLVIVFPLTYQAVLADVRISGFQDLALGTWSGSGDRVASTDLCAYNSDSSSYRITARGTGVANAFILDQNDGPGDISYIVHFRRIGDAYVQLSANMSQAFNGAHTTDQNCNDINNATLRVTVEADALGSAMAGQYSGNITLLMEPD